MNLQLTITNNEFKLIRNLIYDQFGINLCEQKKGLVVGRLRKVLNQNGFNSFGQYYDYVKSDTTGEALKTLIDKISTNHTYFFREKAHFDFLMKNTFPEIAQKIAGSKINNLRIWCAGCSSGEEPYTLAMILLEYFGMKISNWDTGILATDISSEILEKANEAIYATTNVANLPNTYLHKYFKEISKETWAVKDKLKKLVLFKQLNLMREDYPFKGKFDVIFCRNVMIYFDNVKRENLINKFYKYTQPGGYLFVGHAESLTRYQCPYRYIKPGVYKKE